VIPINASWLGTHTFLARASTPFVELESDPVSLTVVLMPTFVKIKADRTLMSIDETVMITGTLVDVYKRPVPNGSCRIVLDAFEENLTTDEKGQFNHSWTAEQLWFGHHFAQAFHDAELPYASSESNSVEITVSIPTAMTFRLFSVRMRLGSYIVGNGSLVANSSDELPFQTVTIYIDDQFVQNVTTAADGEFAISIPSGDLEYGGHLIRAAFQYRDGMWRYCEVVVAFTVISLKPAPYPFFPMLPHLGSGFPETFPYLFFGENAYYTWLFLLVVIAIIVKSIQARRAKKKRAQQQAALIEGTPIGVFEEDFLSKALAEGDGLFDALLSKSPSDPNGRIIWYYNSLITFLTRKRKLSISDSMTHWEVARLLKTLGFPGDNVERITMLFEQALYSGTKLSDVDSVSMSVAMDALRGRKAGGGTPAG
jgi:hypothetical protein